MTFVLDGYSAVIVRIFSHRTAGSKGNKTTCGLFAIVVNKLLKAENKVDVSIQNVLTQFERDLIVLIHVSSLLCF